MASKQLVPHGYDGSSAGTGMASNSLKNADWAANTFKREVKNGHVKKFIERFTRLDDIAQKNHRECKGLQKYVIATRKRYIICSDLEKLLKKNIYKDVDCIVGITGYYICRADGGDYSYNTTRTWFSGVDRFLNMGVLNINNERAIIGGNYDD